VGLRANTMTLCFTVGQNTRQCIALARVFYVLFMKV
jgi:hypothetical protein